MPTLKIIGSLAIRIFGRDHRPPHFHIKTPDGSVLVRIDDFTILKGWIHKKDFDLAIEWARANQGLLFDEWNRLNRP
ncbi:DUF4160 domain-containing protein [Segnochrobactraceae bacterium EtOH-i3]